MVVKNASMDLAQLLTIVHLVWIDGRYHRLAQTKPDVPEKIMLCSKTSQRAYSVVLAVFTQDQRLYTRPTHTCV